MKIVKVAVSRTFNLGNYESLRIAYEAEIADHEDPKTAVKKLADEIEKIGRELKERRESKPKPKPKPKYAPEGAYR